MREKIKILLIKRNITLKELAKRMNTTSQNLSGKFKRDNFSEKDLDEIAQVLNCKFEGIFTLNDTGEKV